MIITCPHCGHDRFTVGRDITIWQTLHISRIDADGNYTVDDDDLHDTVEEGEFAEVANCDNCGEDVPLSHLFPMGTASVMFTKPDRKANL